MPSVGEEDRLRAIAFNQVYSSYKESTAGNKHHKPGTLVSSHDRALSAFAQVASLRLRARRCAISLFDSNTQYVLAEATPTLSLHTNEPEDPKDALLWGGAAVFPLSAGLCQYTLRLPMEFVESYSGGQTEVAVNCVPDMSVDPRFKDVPFVCGFPYTKFYAAVPIRSPNGTPIGSYCVMGDEPRSGLSYGEIAFLKDMATTVMLHLETIRAAQETRRNALFIQGLRSFIEGKSSISEGGRVVRQLVDSGQDWYEQQYAMQRGATPPTVILPSIGAARLGTDGAADILPTVPMPERSLAPPSNSLELLRIDVKRFERNPLMISKTTNKQHQLHGLDIRETFHRAAKVMHESMDLLTGVVLYDASMGQFAAAVDDTREIPRVGNATDSPSHPLPDSSDSSDIEYSRFRRQSYRREATRRCRILGSATSGQSSLDKDDMPGTLAKMTERMLRELLKRHPTGQVFNLDEYSDSASSTSESEELRDTHSKPRTANKQILRSGELRAIRKIFPGVRSFVLVPFYDVNRKCNYSGCFVWSTEDKRVFSMQEMFSLQAFGDTVMAEVARIEARVAERIKSDFISSISHELRSPLHGILGGTQNLRDLKPRQDQEESIHTVDICGRTLLSTVEHLLEFAKVNDLSSASDSDHGTSTRGSDAQVNSDDTAGPRKKMLSRSRSYGLETDVNLVTLTEEVVRAVQAGHAYVNAAPSGHGSRDELRTLPAPTPRRKPMVDVILEIEAAAGKCWKTSGGAWRRIVLNVVGNALKYTSEGHVRVRLHASPSTSSEADEVTLMVSDTGCGMSEEFQATGLFIPWSQEDSMAPGTGLGLSIIKRIVDDIGGSITVKSEKRVGTTVEVRAVLVRVDKEVKATSTDNDLVVEATGISTTDPPHIQEPPEPPPQAPPRAPPVEDPPMPEPIIPVSSSQGRTTKRFLLVDDNDINLRLLVMYMKKQGYYYETASNGLEALNAFQGVRSIISQPEDGHLVAGINTTPANATATAEFQPFDYVLMDISMPVMDGLESTRRIRAHERRVAGERRSTATSRRPATIIALTGLASTQTRQDAFASGVDMYMTKPFRIADLAKITAKEQ